VSPRELAQYPDVETLSRAAADLIAGLAQQAVAARGRFSIALSGGSTPRTLYRLLAAEYRTRIPWTATEIFFGDERCVPPDHPDSNFRLARTELLDQIPGLLSRTHRIEGELPPEDAARKYDAMLRTMFSAVAFDVLLLGVGTDGHTASLFPGSPALNEQTKWAAATEAPPTMTTRHRVTLTFPVLNAARTTIVLCAGTDKRTVLHDILTDPSATSRYPAARIAAQERLVWMIDHAAAPVAHSIP
jgi:6-phosphogluconolactonase